MKLSQRSVIAFCAALWIGSGSGVVAQTSEMLTRPNDKVASAQTPFGRLTVPKLIQETRTEDEFLLPDAVLESQSSSFDRPIPLLQNSFSIRLNDPQATRRRLVRGHKTRQREEAVSRIRHKAQISIAKVTLRRSRQPAANIIVAMPMVLLPTVKRP